MGRDKNTNLSEEELSALLSISPPTLDIETDHDPKSVEIGDWEPDLNPTQKKIFNDPADYTLTHGERGSGKSISALHKLIRHCYENNDAVAVIITPGLRAGSLGVVDDLVSLILPLWKEGIGLEYTQPKMDPYTKDKGIKIANRFGGWSLVLQISIPYASAIAARFKNVKPSFIMVDEMTDLNGEEYFYHTISELKRRRGITGPQQFIGCCNPKGPSHWVYKIFFERCIDPKTGKRDPRYAVYHVPFSENAHRPEMANYAAQMLEATKNDETLYRRHVLGEWVDYPTGETIFKGFFIPDRHVVGKLSGNTGIVPVKGYPCSIGYDIGQVHNAAIFEQFVFTSSGLMLLAFDEIVHIGEKIMYKQIAIEIIERILEWNDIVGDKMIWEHISDDSAVNQFRPNSGSYDAWEFQSEFNMACLKHQLPEMHIEGCPKGSGSVGARVRLTQNRLKQDKLLVSDRCTRVKSMFTMLEHEEDDPMKPKKNAAGHIHVFDAFSYPILNFDLKEAPRQGAVVKSVRVI